jgi:putative ATP-dependent endonuclease of the OLD family
LLIGVNNSGKSNLIDAIRVFYEKDLKFEEDRDFPKLFTKDKESWIEIVFQLSNEEITTLKSEYKNSNNTLRVRKYLLTKELDEEKKPKSGIYPYVNGKLENTRFYGVKNVSLGKLGDVIYIPAVSRLDDLTKLTGPSALRDLINTVLKKIMDTSPAYGGLKSAFDAFSDRIKTESTENGHSLHTIEQEISKEINDWGTSFEFYINPITPDDLVKSLIGHRIHDRALDLAQDSKCYGQGFQRHMVFTLIKLSAKYSINPKPTNKTDFSPQLTWLLFEEPEAFLHPSQIDALDENLHTLSLSDGNQVLITTHNPEFVSRNMNELPSLIHLCRKDIQTTFGQISSDKLAEIFFENQTEVQHWLKNPEIQRKTNPEDFMLDMEGIKYALWLDPKRSTAFFANKVLLVEGPTETALLGYLMGIGQIPPVIGGLFILDAIGKFNIHRFMNLFGELKIDHAVLIDNDKNKYPEVDSSINSARNPFTIGIDQFPEDIEGYLGIPKTGSPHKKPQHIMWYLQNGKIEQKKLDDLILKVQKVLLI